MLPAPLPHMSLVSVYPLPAAILLPVPAARTCTFSALPIYVWPVFNYSHALPLYYDSLSPWATMYPLQTIVPPELTRSKNLLRLSSTPPPSEVSFQSSPTPDLTSWDCAGLLDSRRLTGTEVFRGTWNYPPLWCVPPHPILSNWTWPLNNSQR